MNPFGNCNGDNNEKSNIGSHKPGKTLRLMKGKISTPFGKILLQCSLLNEQHVKILKNAKTQ